MIRICFKTTPIIMKFLEQGILPRIMPVSKSVFVVNINFVRHPTIMMNIKCNHLKKIVIPKNNFPFQFNAASCPAMKQGHLRLESRNLTTREIRLPRSSYLVIGSLNHQNDYEIYWESLLAFQFRTSGIRESLCVFSIYFPI